MSTLSKWQVLAQANLDYWTEFWEAAKQDRSRLVSAVESDESRPCPDPLPHKKSALIDALTALNGPKAPPEVRRLLNRLTRVGDTPLGVHLVERVDCETAGARVDLLQAVHDRAVEKGATTSETEQQKAKRERQAKIPELLDRFKGSQAAVARHLGEKNWTISRDMKDLGLRG